jgi:dUTP pyrophosphatase
MGDQITKTGMFRYEDISVPTKKQRDKVRGFELVLPKFRHSLKPLLPIQGTSKSAGYDFRLPEDVEIIIQPKETVWIPSDVRAYMGDDEALFLYIRSHIGKNLGLKIGNCVDVIDTDYYNDPETGGNISIALENRTDEIIKLVGGQRYIQGVFQPVLRADNCNSNVVRNGGSGSTGV